MLARVILVAAVLLSTLSLQGCGKCGFENPFKSCSDHTG
jgi:hypothetical protein